MLIGLIACKVEQSDLFLLLSRIIGVNAGSAPLTCSHMCIDTDKQERKTSIVIHMRNELQCIVQTQMYYIVLALIIHMRYLYLNATEYRI